MVEKTKRHIENYKKQDIFADATQAREGIETGMRQVDIKEEQMQLKPVRALKPPSVLYSSAFLRCNSSP